MVQYFPKCLLYGVHSVDRFREKEIFGKIKYTFM